MHAKPENEITLDRVLALTALAAAGYYSYGWRIPLLCGLAAAAAMITELICLYIRKIPFGFRHLDAAVTGIVLVMMMPPSVPFSVVIMSAIFAIITGRALFGGREHPVIPAAAVGYCFALLNFRQELTSFPAEFSVLPLYSKQNELAEGVTALFNRTGKFTPYILDWLTGMPGQPIGTGSLVLLLVIAVVLILRRSASGWVIVPMLTVLITGGIMAARLRNPELHAVAACLTNQTLFAVIFLYGDPAYAPPHIAGVLYGMLSAVVILLAEQLCPAYDIPIIIAVLFSPAAIFLRYLMSPAPDAIPKRTVKTP